MITQNHTDQTVQQVQFLATSIKRSNKIDALNEIKDEQQSTIADSWMTSNNETVYRPMLRAGNIPKTMTSNGKQVTVTEKFDLKLDSAFPICL